MVETYDDRTFAQKVKARITVTIDRAKWNARRLGRWISQHPTEFIGLCTVSITAIGAATKGVKGLIGEIDRVAEKRDERCRVWDPVNGIFWRTKHPLTTSQQLELERRVMMNENRGDILDSMNVLRKR